MILGGIPGDLKTKYQGDFNDFGLGALPQGGGNATLGGGYANMFNAKSSPEKIKAAIDWICYRFFNPTEFEAGLKVSQAKGDAIGFPDVAILSGQAQQQRQDLVNKYANLPVQNYQPFVEGMKTIKIRTEPPIEVQKMYAAIDPAVQAVLTDQSADPKAQLDTVAKQFQSTVLDQAKATQ
jgi:ABC-type glycerol-3-phosphate transport system substrate-binding protein